MVHIEVFLGGKTGEKTIGSRTSINQVSYHDSYRFVSRRYANIKYHFKSLDTWLDGICKSWCPEHKWITPKYSLVEGNNPKLVRKFLNKRYMEELDKSANTEKAKLRWTNKPSEISFKHFTEGRNLANHLSNSSILTNKSKFLKMIRNLDASLKKGTISSELFSGTKDFFQETYSLERNKEMLAFLAKPNEGSWVLKSTSPIDNTENNCITLIGDVS